MRLFLTTLAVLVAALASDAGAQSRSYSSSRGYSSSNSGFLYRGYNPGHIFGNSVRRLVWGPSMGPGR